MAETKTKVSLSSGSPGRGPGRHKADCQCPFCKAKRTKEARDAGDSVFSQPAPEPEAHSTPASAKREKAESSAETLQAAHDLGNAVWPDPRWDLPTKEAIEWGETTVALRERFEIADTVLGGGIFGRPIAKLLKIERHRAMEIIPQQGLLRKRTRQKKQADATGQNGSMPGDAIPLGAVPHEQWEQMGEVERQATIERFRQTYGGMSQSPPPIEGAPDEGIPTR